MRRRRSACRVMGLLIPALLAISQTREPPPAPEQPVPFSHKAHAGTLQLKCKMCHPNSDPGELMSIAAPAVCMQCHSTVKSDSSHIQKLASFAEKNASLPWVRVYEIPSYVNFSHRTHLEGGIACTDCHGPVAEREKLSREGDISMGGCMKCHQAKQVSVDCVLCHEPR